MKSQAQCDKSRHILHYSGKVKNVDKEDKTKKYKSWCERCEHTFINSMPIGEGAPKAE